MFTSSVGNAYFALVILVENESGHLFWSFLQAFRLANIVLLNMFSILVLSRSITGIINEVNSTVDIVFKRSTTAIVDFENQLEV